MTKGALVPLNVINVTKCLCPKCPVQRKSQCAVAKSAVMKDALSQNPLVAENIPAQYCSSGTAACKDIDTSQRCICGACAVFKSYGLDTHAPAYYYCRDGSAQ